MPEKQRTNLSKLEYARARKVGQIRALEYVRGYVEGQISVETKELKELEQQMNSLFQT